MKDVRGVILAEDEVIIREYEASYINNPKSEGYVIATNRRLIFTGSTSKALGSSILIRDTKIDSITGVYGGLTRKRSIIQIIIGILIVLMSSYSLIEDGGMFSFIFLLIGIIITYLGFNASGVQMYLYVLSSLSSPTISVSVEASRGWFSKINLHDASMTVSASGPGKHTEQMIRELGALVQDIQTMGDLAINKWNNQQMVDEVIQPKPTTSEQLSTVVSTVKETAATASEVAKKAKESEQFKASVTSMKETATKVKEKAVTASESVIEATKKVRDNHEEKSIDLQKTKTCECGNVCGEEANFCTQCGKKLDIN